MERLAQLIGKLNEQFAQNADPFQLLVTTQLIETELVQMSTSTHRTVNSSKVAVVMPAANGHSYQHRHTAAEISTPAAVKAPPVVEAPPVAAPQVVVETPAVVEIPAMAEAEPVINGTFNGSNGIVDKNNGHHHHEPEHADHGVKFDPIRVDPLREVPTLAHQHAVKELNEVMASKQ